MHAGLSPLQCVVCKKQFSHKRNIRPHMRLHVSLLQHFLPMKLNFILSLNVLILLQTGQKKYQCDRCGKEYFHKSSFTLHMAYHDGIRTENCPHCPRQFMVKTDLEKHIRIHVSSRKVKFPFNIKIVYLISSTHCVRPAKSPTHAHCAEKNLQGVIICGNIKKFTTNKKKKRKLIPVRNVMHRFHDPQNFTNTWRSMG